MLDLRSSWSANTLRLTLGMVPLVQDVSVFLEGGKNVNFREFWRCLGNSFLEERRNKRIISSETCGSNLLLS